MEGAKGAKGGEGAEGAEGGVPVPVSVPGEVPCEASAFADAVRTRGEAGGAAAGATLLALRLSASRLPDLGSGFGGTAASVGTRQLASQPQRTFKRGVARRARSKRPRAR